jgi:hypothetical protein
MGLNNNRDSINECTIDWTIDLNPPTSVLFSITLKNDTVDHEWICGGAMDGGRAVSNSSLAIDAIVNLVEDIASGI